MMKTSFKKTLAVSIALCMLLAFMPTAFIMSGSAASYLTVSGTDFTAVPFSSPSDTNYTGGGWSYAYATKTLTVTASGVKISGSLSDLKVVVNSTTAVILSLDSFEGTSITSTNCPQLTIRPYASAASASKLTNASGAAINVTGDLVIQGTLNSSLLHNSQLEATSFANDAIIADNVEIRDVLLKATTSAANSYSIDADGKITVFNSVVMLGNTPDASSVYVGKSAYYINNTLQQSGIVPNGFAVGSALQPSAASGLELAGSADACTVALADALVTWTVNDDANENSVTFDWSDEAPVDCIDPILAAAIVETAGQHDTITLPVVCVDGVPLRWTVDGTVYPYGGTITLPDEYAITLTLDEYPADEVNIFHTFYNYTLDEYFPVVPALEGADIKVVDYLGAAPYAPATAPAAGDPLAVMVTTDAGYEVTDIAYTYYYDNAGTIASTTVQLLSGGSSTGTFYAPFLMPSAVRDIVISVKLQKIDYEVVLLSENLIGVILDATEGCVVTHTDEVNYNGSDRIAHVGDTVALKYAADTSKYDNTIAPRVRFFKANIEVTTDIKAQADYAEFHAADDSYDTVTFTMPDYDIAVYVQYPIVSKAKLATQHHADEIAAFEAIYTGLDYALVNTVDVGNFTNNTLTPTGIIIKDEEGNVDESLAVYQMPAGAIGGPGFYYVLAIWPDGQGIGADLDDIIVRIDLDGDDVWDATYTSADFINVVNLDKLFVLLGTDRVFQQTEDIQIMVDWDGDTELPSYNGFEYSAGYYHMVTSEITLQETSKAVINDYRGNEDLLGYTWNDLMYDDVDITVDAADATQFAAAGTIKFVNTYEGFNGNDSETEGGNYIAFDIKNIFDQVGSEFPNMTMTATGDYEGAVTYNWPAYTGDSQVIVWKLTEETKTGITFLIDWDGEAGLEYTPVTYYLDLTALVLQNQSSMEILPYEGDILGRNTSTLQNHYDITRPDPDYSVYKAVGDVIYNTEAWTEFSSTDNTGYFIAFKLVVPEQVNPETFYEKLSLMMENGAGNIYDYGLAYNYFDDTYELYFVLRITADVTIGNENRAMYDNVYLYVDWDGGYVIDGSGNIEEPEDAEPTAYNMRKYTLNLENLWLQVPSTDAEISIISGSEALLGLTASDLIVADSDTLADDYILKYVTGYTGFSSNEEEQSGYYLPLVITLPAAVPYGGVDDYEDIIVKFISDRVGATEFTYSFASFDGANYMYIVVRIADESQLVNLNFSFDYDGEETKYYETDYDFDPVGTVRLMTGATLEIYDGTADLYGKTADELHDDASIEVVGASCNTWITNGEFGYNESYGADGIILWQGEGYRDTVDDTERNGYFFAVKVTPYGVSDLSNAVVTSQFWDDNLGVMAYVGSQLVSSYTDFTDGSLVLVWQIPGFEDGKYLDFYIDWDGAGDLFDNSLYSIITGGFWLQAPSLVDIYVPDNTVDLLGLTADDLGYGMTITDTHEAGVWIADGYLNYVENYDGFTAGIDGYFFPMVIENAYDLSASDIENMVITAQGDYEGATLFSYDYYDTEDGGELVLVWQIQKDTRTGISFNIDWDGPDVNMYYNSEWYVDLSGISFESIAEFIRVDDDVLTEVAMDDIYGIDHADMMDVNVEVTDSDPYVRTTKTVPGKLLYVGSFADYDGTHASVGAEQSGYYLALQVKNLNGLSGAELERAIVSSDLAGTEKVYTYTDLVNDTVILIWRISEFTNDSFTVTMDWDGDAVNPAWDSDDHTGDGYHAATYTIDLSTIMLESYAEIADTYTFDGDLIYTETNVGFSADEWYQKGWFYNFVIDLPDDADIDYEDITVTITPYDEDGKREQDAVVYDYSDLDFGTTVYDVTLPVEWRFYNNKTVKLEVVVDYDDAALLGVDERDAYSVETYNYDVAFNYYYDIAFNAGVSMMNFYLPYPPFFDCTNDPILGAMDNILVEYSVAQELPTNGYVSSYGNYFMGWSWIPVEYTFNILGQVSDVDYTIFYADGADICLPDDQGDVITTPVAYPDSGILMYGTTLYAIWDQLFSFTIDPDVQNGTITSTSSELHFAGDKIYFTATPSEGYIFDGIYFIDPANRVIKLDSYESDDLALGQYYFVMPYCNVFLKANYIIDEDYEPNTVDTEFVLGEFSGLPIGNYNFLNIALTVSAEDIEANDFLYVYVIVGNVGYILNVRDLIDENGWFRTTLMLPKDEIAFLYLVNDVTADPYSSGFEYLANAVVDGTTYM